MLQGKSILQELCSLHLEWDDPIPEDVKMRWEKWRMELMKLQSIMILQCYKPKGFSQVVRAELHHSVMQASGATASVAMYIS